MLTHQYNHHHMAIKPKAVTAVLALACTLLTSPAYSASTTTHNLLFATEYLDYGLPKVVTEICYEADNCPEVLVEYAATNHPWINRTINQQINAALLGQDSQQSSTQHSDAASGNQKKQQAAIQRSLSEFVSEPFITASDDEMRRSFMNAYNLTIQPHYIGHVNGLELFAVDYYQYTGGAHGLPSRDLLVFDPALKRQLDLDAILIAGKESQLDALVYDAYKQWVRSDMQADVADYEQSWPYFFSETFSFDESGMWFLYQPYGIAPYASGMPQLHVPYSKLRGVLQPRYLPSQ